MPREGRKPKLTPEMQERICDSIRAGNYKDTAAATSGIHEATLYRWIAKGEESESGIYHEFCKAVKEAEQEAEAKALAVIQKAANGYNVAKTKTVTSKDGDITVTEETTHEFNWQAAAWYLERTRGDKYRRKESREHTGPDGGPVRVTLGDLWGDDGDTDEATDDY